MSDLRIGDHVYHERYGHGVVDGNEYSNGVRNGREQHVLFDGVRRSCRPSGLRLIDADRGPRILVIDIETMANLVWAWGTWQQNIAPNQIVEPKRTICFAAKWAGEDGVEFYSEFHDGRADMIEAAWGLIDEADAIVGYNSKRFDIKHLGTEFLLAGYRPPSHFQHIDLYQIAKREFAFSSNKLGSVAERLELGEKMEHEGMSLWTKCEGGDAEAWDRMRAYNVQDVLLTEQLFDELRPWIPLRGTQSQKRLREVLGT